MKKLFVSLMAIAALVSCSKEEEAIAPAIDSISKSVEIKIENAVASRAGEAGNTTATAGTTISSVVNASELKILFANASGVILKEMPLVGTANNHNGGEDSKTDLPEYSYGSFTGSEAENDDARNGVYVFHNVPAAVTQIAVVRYEAGDIKDAEGKAGNVVAGTTKISAVEAAAKSEELNLQRELEDIVLYDADPLVATTGECVTIGGIKYYIYTASVTVAPVFSRLEISQIKCTDLGEANDDADPATVDFDKLDLKSFTWSSYKIDEDELGVLNGQYNGAANNTVESEAARTCKPADGKVWSWNIEPQAFSTMTLNMVASATDYLVAGYNADKGGADVNLYITGLAAAEGSNWNGSYVVNNIYQLAVDFPQSALADQQGICANVTVTIVPWTVNTVTPVFGTTGGSNAQ